MLYALRFAMLCSYAATLCLHPSNIGLHCPQGLSFTDVQPFCCRCQHLCSVGRCCSDVWICTFLPTSFSYRLRVLAVNCCACMCVLYFTTPWNVRIAFNGFMSGSRILAELPWKSKLNSIYLLQDAFHKMPDRMRMGTVTKLANASISQDNLTRPSNVVK